MARIIFFLCLVAEIILTCILIAGLLATDFRIWPPADKFPRGKKIIISLFYTISLLIILLGILSWPSAILPRSIRLVGAVIWLAGLSLSSLALNTLGNEASFGKEDRLLEKGPYRFSRNPQYLGFIICLIGWGVFISSPFLMISCAAGIVPLLIVPFLEEPWLEEKYPEAYPAYQDRVPRWIDIKLVLKEYT